MNRETELGGPAREFPATRWTLILSARDSPDARRAALENLFGSYWKPLYVHARRRGLPVEDAKDAIQGFLVHLLEGEFLSRLDPARGRFRAYLRTALDHFLANLHEARSAQKRGGGARVVSMDFDVAERDLAADPQASFDREWAVGVMERALARLRREFEEGRRRGPLDVALRFFGPGETPSYAEAAAAAGMTEAQFKAFLHRARARFRELVREEVAPTVEDSGEVDAEIAELMRSLAR